MVVLLRSFYFGVFFGRIHPLFAQAMCESIAGQMMSGCFLLIAQNSVAGKIG